MRVTSATAGCAAALLFLVGCSPAASNSGSESASENSAKSSPTPTPTIPTGPVALTKQEAGERYLDLICQRNDVGAKLNAAFEAKESAYLDGESVDVSAVTTIATEALRVNRVTVELIDDTYYTWPDNTGELLQAIKGSLLGEAQTFSEIANATSFADAYNTPASSVDPGTAPQELRYKLGLAADTTASCKGKEEAADVLHAEMTERNEYLAKFPSDTDAE